jgi:hypothetical protein
MEAAGQVSESNVANALADYRFCAYRLQVLKEGGDPESPAIAAVAARMARLTTEYPSIRQSAAGRYRT